MKTAICFIMLSVLYHKTDTFLEQYARNNLYNHKWPHSDIVGKTRIQRNNYKIVFNKKYNLLYLNLFRIYNIFYKKNH